VLLKSAEHWMRLRGERLIHRIADLRTPHKFERFLFFFVF
jgi:hypothetical protein